MSILSLIILIGFSLFCLSVSMEASKSSDKLKQKSLGLLGFFVFLGLAFIVYLNYIKV